MQYVDDHVFGQATIVIQRGDGRLNGMGDGDRVAAFDLDHVDGQGLFAISECRALGVRRAQGDGRNVGNANGLAASTGYNDIAKAFDQIHIGVDLDGLHQQAFNDRTGGQGLVVLLEGGDDVANADAEGIEQIPDRRQY